MRTGRQITGSDLTNSVRARFWSKVVKTESCWLWTSYILPNGYPRFSIRAGFQAYAHRISYVLSKGEIPEGLDLDHLCRNTQCVNPDHLEAVTAQVNTLRGIGPAAKNFFKTECKRGHPFVEGNIYWSRNGRGRSCKTCVRVRMAA